MTGAPRIAVLPLDDRPVNYDCPRKPAAIAGAEALLRRSPEESCRAAIEAVRQGRDVAIADVAFANGSDLLPGDQFVERPEIARLAAYGGWNTAGNTLGEFGFDVEVKMP